MVIGVHTPVQQLQYITPMFIIPKKEGTVRFLMYYHRLNQKLVRNTNLLSRIGKTMHKLEVFHYVTVLQLNMGYCITVQ